ncbi:hypothetical protein [Arthrobacter sp. H5]|uniref:FMN-binding protein n=1 Tax=Arthrobacter sp. H5 TaxID=1267973 RepID=UPI00048384C7|nr:hypothetical protein [Arthrobacter sp. H5]
MSTSPRRWAVTGLAAVSLLGTAGCAASSPAPAGGSGITGPYADGTYTQSGSYQTPGGEETINVTLTVESDVVTDAVAEPMPSNPTTELYQGKFSSGIKEQIVGRNLDELDVTKVSGSSLTSSGFRSAVDQIKAEAVQ